MRNSYFSVLTEKGGGGGGRARGEKATPPKKHPINKNSQLLIKEQYNSILTIFL